MCGSSEYLNFLAPSCTYLHTLKSKKKTVDFAVDIMRQSSFDWNWHSYRQGQTIAEQSFWVFEDFSVMLNV